MRKILVSLGFVCLVTAGAAHAQFCAIDDTIADCWSRAGAGEEVKDDLVRSETSVATAGANLDTNLKDFVKPLVVSLLAGESSSEEGAEGTAVVDFSFLLLPQIRERQGQLKLVLNTDAGLYEPLKTALAEDGGGGEGGDDRTAALSAEIGEIGEFTASFSANWRGSKLGRYFGPHRELFGELVDAAGASLSPTSRAFLDFLAAVPQQNTCSVDLEQCTFLQAAGGDRALAGSLRDRLVRAAKEEAAVGPALEQALAVTKLDRFAVLVANQPQLHVAVNHTERQTVVGPDEWAAEVTYERPMAPNVNRQREECGAAADLDCYTRYVKNHESDLESADRLSFSAKYVDREALEVLVPDEETPRTFAASREWIVKAGWGRVLELDDEGIAKTRVDVVGSYEDVSSDAARTDRGLVTVTVTRDFGTFSVPFGVVYSNKPEFLTAQEPDEQISAHVGIKYSIEPKK